MPYEKSCYLNNRFKTERASLWAMYDEGLVPKASLRNLDVDWDGRPWRTFRCWKKYRKTQYRPIEYA